MMLERRGNDEGVRVCHRQGHKVMEVDTRKARYQGIRWCDLNSFAKRKYENLLVISPVRCPHHCTRCLSRDPVKVLYV